MVESFVETLVAVAVGAILGFFSSIGYSALQGWLHNKTLRMRLKNELLSIRDQIKADLQAGAIKPKSYLRDYFMYHASGNQTEEAV